MYFTIEQISSSLQNLEKYHAFYGISFLVAKRGKLPVGSTMEFPIDSEEHKFLNEFYRPYPDIKSKTPFYRVFRTSDKAKAWLKHDYASSGSQRGRTGGPFAAVFSHKSGTQIWGWQANYLEILTSQRRLTKYGKPLAFDLAVWLYRTYEWSDDISAKDVVNKFFDDFSITKEEQDALFEINLPNQSDFISLFQKRPITQDELKSVIGLPPDLPPEEGGTLAYLEIVGVGPSRKLSIELSQRVNIITGDNGLGKSFVLDCAWWALSGKWAGLPAYPRDDISGSEAKIVFRIASNESAHKNIEALYHWQSHCQAPIFRAG
jgi:hypothetical protein